MYLNRSLIVLWKIAGAQLSLNGKTLNWYVLSCVMNGVVGFVSLCVVVFASILRLGPM